MPVRFLIKCRSCKWTQGTTGLAKDLEGLKEIMPSCSTCGRPRRFVCPKCRGVSVMSRVNC